MADKFAATPVKGLHSRGDAVLASDILAVLAAVASAAAPTYVEGTEQSLSVDLSGALRVALSSGNVEISNDVGNPIPVSGTVEITNDVGNPIPVSGTVTITDGSGPVTVDGTVVVSSITGEVEVKNDSGNPLAVSGTVDLSSASLAALESIDLNAATLAALESIDLNASTITALQQIFVRSAAVSDTNPLPVNVQTNPGALTDTVLFSSSLAAGASHDFDDTALTGALVGKLTQFTADSSVRIKAELFTVTAGGVAASRRVFFTDPTAAAIIYATPDLDTIVAPALGHFRVTITNLDTANAADVYGSLTRVEI